MTLFDIIIDFFRDIFSFDQEHPLLFTQIYFWVFFAIVFTFFTLFKNKILLRNSFLFFVSLFFYYKTSGLFVLLLLFTTVYNYFAAKWIDSRKTSSGQKAVLIVSLIVNLFFLSYYKYAYFFTDAINDLFGTQFAVFDLFAWIGNGFNSAGRFSVDTILLPVGISFFTFQAISYIIDIYRKKISPVSNFLDFGFYLTFFPQLVAGPIVRASEFIPQLHKPFFLSRRQFGIAVFWIMNGLAKKIILSDYIAVNFIDRVFENPLLYSGFENLAALFGYSLQVYADFSGYTDIAIGTAMMMGFYLPKNFNSPYKATNPGGFWKRWHMSLSNWLKDYLYIPLGGNRNDTFGTYACIITLTLIAVILSGSIWVAIVAALLTLIISLTAYLRPESRKKIITNINNMDTMLLGGLWHGASWNFIIWGGLNGIGILAYKFWRDWSIYRRTAMVFLATAILGILVVVQPLPLFNLLFVWSSILLFGTFIQMFYHLFKGKRKFTVLNRAWSIFLTFVFITFTRLFFRSGSNLDPAEANEVAWNTAKNMVNQIGSSWSLDKIPQMLYEYRFIFILIVAGMIIHWLPEKFKRRYRLTFAQLPLPLMVIAVVLIVFILYQFITADLQKFIYFQF